MCGYVLNRKEKSKNAKNYFSVILSWNDVSIPDGSSWSVQAGKKPDLPNTLTAVIFIDIAINIPFATFNENLFLQFL